MLTIRRLTIYTAVFFAMVGLMGVANAQDPIKRKISVFTHDSNGSKQASAPSNPPINIFKINPTLFFRGVVPVYYERMLSSNTSFEIAPGITFRDEIFEIQNDIDFGDERTVTVNPGFFMNFGIRFYPENTGYATGIYVAPELSIRNYNINKQFDLSQPIPFGNKQEKVDVGYNFQEFKFLLGYQDDSYSDVFYIDYYLGVGGRQSTQLDARVVNDPSGSGEQRVNIQRIRNFSPAFFLGIKLAVAF